MSKWNAGDTIIVSRQAREPINTTISRVGRKYFFAEIHGREVKFALTDGIEPSDYIGRRAWTPQDYADSGRNGALRTSLRNLGVGQIPLWVSTDALADILEIMQGEKAAQSSKEKEDD